MQICKNCSKSYSIPTINGKDANWDKHNNAVEKRKGTVNSYNFCSYECGKNYKLNKMQSTCLSKYGCKNPSNSELINNKRKDTFIKKYGVPNPFQCDAIKDKIKNTCIERYGVENPNQSNIIKNNKKINNIKKYGVDHPMKSDTIKDKVKNTNIEKYGVTCTLHNSEVNEKSKATWMKKYGVDHPMKSNIIKNKVNAVFQEKYGSNPLSNEDIKNKIKSTNIEKYGVACTLSSPEIRKKIETTNIEKYGSKSVFSNEQIKSKIRNTNIERYGYKCSLLNDNVRFKIKTNSIEKYGTPYPAASESAKERRKNTNIKRYGVPYYVMTEDCRNTTGVVSKSNILLAEMIKTYNMNPDYEKRVNNFSYDLSINEFPNILIELDPWITHNVTVEHPKFKRIMCDKYYHQQKTLNAKNNGYHCIHIFDWDDKSKIIKLFFNKKIQVDARECKLINVSFKDYKSLIDANHLQGCTRHLKTNVYLGLVYKNKLIQVMSFGIPRYNKSCDWELLRYCTDSDYKVRFGADRLFKNFIKMHPNESIISYCDNSKFNGEVYKKLGFELINYGEPRRHWYNPNFKDVNTNEYTGPRHITDNLLYQQGADRLIGTKLGKGTSNHDILREHGFVEIYDCGQSTWVYKNNKLQRSN